MPPCLSTYSNSAHWWLKPSSFSGHQEKCSGISRWIDLRSYCSSCQLGFFSKDGWRKWKSMSLSSQFTAWNANFCWNMLTILFQRLQPPADGWDWQCRVASATRHELLGLYIMLGLGDWSLCGISLTTSPKLYRLYIHISREHAAYGKLQSMADAIASGDKHTWACLATRSQTSLTTLGRARAWFSSPLERVFAVLSFILNEDIRDFVFLSFCYRMLCCLFQALFQNWAFWWC